MLADMAGLALTLLGLALLAAGGYLAALRMLGGEAGRDPLALAIASLLAAFAEAVGIGLLLGAAGLLRLELGFAAQALLVAALARGRRRAYPAGAVATAAGLREPARQLARRTWERLREHPALSLLAANAVASEALRGLLRPPLSWDSLMYHLLLTASWVQGHDLAPVFGGYPVNDYGFVPANGSIWLWWWMAPSHSELYVNLAALPHWVLLGLAAGGVARQLGARRHWPLAAFLVVLTPTVVRFAATQYADILVGGTLLAACFFALRWMERPRAAEVVLAGAGLGLACGAKILGPPYAVTLAAAVALMAPWRPGQWRQRLPQAALAILLTAGLGSYFYVRNIALGAGPLALGCEGREGIDNAASTMTPAGAATMTTTATRVTTTATAAPAAVAASRSPGAAGRRILPPLPRRGSVVNLWAQLGGRQVLDVFLGVTRPQSVELAVGPQVFLLLAAFLALPFGVAARHRRAALVAASQIAFEVIFWLMVPYAGNQNVYSNVRYLIPAFGLAFAGGVAIAERLGMSDLWLRGIAILLACQSLLQLHAEMPRGVRIAIAIADVAAVALAASPALRGSVRRRAGALAVAALLLALLGAPRLARFRAADRARAMASEWTAHSTSAHVFAGGWGWLDAHGDGGAVDAVGSPGTYFLYPAMGAFLQRRVHYVNINRADHRLAILYPGCNPRIDPSPQAWLENVARSGVRWLLIYRYPEFHFPIEGGWANDRPDRFALRYEDITTLIFEVLPPAVPAGKAAPTASAATAAPTAPAAPASTAPPAARVPAPIAGQRPPGQPTG